MRSQAQSKPAWRKKPSSYLRRRMSTCGMALHVPNVGAATVEESPASRAIYASRPAEVAAVIKKAVQA